MKSYLDLVPISAKVHRKQNRMSVFCIILAVFLVTVIFGMADMFIRSQIIQAQKEEGNLHLMIRDISDEQAALIAARPEIRHSSWYGVLNYDGSLDYTIGGKNAVLCGSDESFITDMQVDAVTEGSFPKNDQEALVSGNVKAMLDVKIGDPITVHTPDGSDLSFTISGFMKHVPKLMSEDSYGIFLTTDAYRAVYPSGSGREADDCNSVFYIQFANHSRIQQTIADMKRQFGLSEEQVSENTKLLGLLGQSGNSFMLQIYGSAGILFVMVLLAGILMITSSLNSNIAQRTEFFGMIRCIGATPKQIMRLVRREALRWCRFAIPMGVGVGVLVIWVLCAILRFLSPEYFGDMPALAISWPSILSGVGVGILTVLLAARMPAKRASRVSPLAAVTGNANDLQPVRKAANTALLKVDTSLGVHHAKSSRKNFLLVVGSFSLSIILFLSFSVTVDFMNHSFTPLDPWAPDLSVISPDHSCSVDAALLGQVKEHPAVKRVYGRMFAYNVPVTLEDGTAKEAGLISYEETQFAWAEDYMLEGSVDEVKEQTGTGLIVYEPQSSVRVGDTISVDVNGQISEIRIVGMLSESPFYGAANVEEIICSEDTFRQVTRANNYTIIDIQLTKHATDQDVNEIHRLAGTGYTFSDERMGNSSVYGILYSFRLFIYGFLSVIALITIFNIINSTAMSVTARMKQYGAFRAIGLSTKQLAKMIITEALTYAVVGCLCGSVLGLMFNKLLYEKMITFYWGLPWRFPLPELLIILLIVMFSVILAVINPIRKIREMSIVDTINAR